MIMLPVLVDKMVAKRDVPKDLRQRWMEQSVELKRKLHNSVGHVLQVSVVLKCFKLLYIISDGLF
jgi:hypothetical protein